MVFANIPGSTNSDLLPDDAEPKPAQAPTPDTAVVLFRARIFCEGLQHTSLFK